MTKIGKSKTNKSTGNGASLGFEAKLFQAADKMRSGVSQQELAKQLKKPQSFISKYEYIQVRNWRTPSRRD